MTAFQTQRQHYHSQSPTREKYFPFPNILMGYRFNPLIAFVLVIIILFSSYLKINDAAVVSPAFNDNGNSRSTVNNSNHVHYSNEMEVKYELVEDVPDHHVRFKALYRNREDSSNHQNDNEWEPLSIQKWAQLLSAKEGNQSMRLASEITKVIVDACPKYDAFFFETKGTSSKNSDTKQFEFVLVNAPSLYRFAESRADPYSFQNYLNCPSCETKTAVSFWNLGRNAMLIAPRRQDDKDLKIYSHLAAFLRGASEAETNQMWNHVTEKYLEITTQWDGNPVWLSTAGTGVAWLHFRLDRRPKYYTFREFKMET